MNEVRNFGSLCFKDFCSAQIICQLHYFFLVKNFVWTLLLVEFDWYSIFAALCHTVKSEFFRSFSYSTWLYWKWMRCNGRGKLYQRWNVWSWNSSFFSFWGHILWRPWSVWWYFGVKWGNINQMMNMCVMYDQQSVTLSFTALLFPDILSVLYTIIGRWNLIMFSSSLHHTNIASFW